MSFPRFFLLITVTAMVVKLSDAQSLGDVDNARDGSSLTRAMPVPRGIADPKDWEFKQVMLRFPVKLHVKFSVSFRGTRVLDRNYQIVEVESQTGEKAVMYFDLGIDDVPTSNQALQLTTDRSVTTL
jgi:hypothetical protein